MTKPMSRPDYDVVLFVAQSSGAQLDEARMEITNAMVESGMAYENARALLALFQVLAIEAGVEGPTLHLVLDDITADENDDPLQDAGDH